MNKSDNFKTITITTFVITILILVVLFVLNINKGLEIRTFNIEGRKESAFLNSNSVKIEFNTPLKNYTDSELKNLIKINPKVNFTAFSNSTTLLIRFDEGLKGNTNYKLQISTGIQDIYSRELSTNPEYEFKTKDLEFAYINYQVNKKKLVRNNIELNNEKVIFEAENIVDFDSNNYYYAIVTEHTNRTNNIVLLNKNGNIIKDFELKNKRIRNVVLSNKFNDLIFVSIDIQPSEGFPIPLDVGMLNIYNIESETLRKVSFKDNNIEPGDLFFAPDGKTLLIKNQLGSEYYLTNISDQNPELIAVGKHLQSGGFNYLGDQIAFIDYDPLEQFESLPYISIYNASRDSTNIQNTGTFNIDPRFYNLKNKILFSEKYKELESTKGIFKISEFDLDTKKTKEILRIENLSLELPQISFDDNYLLIEKFSKQDLTTFQNLRPYEFQAKPPTGKLVLYNLQTKQIIKDDIVGIEAVWE